MGSDCKSLIDRMSPVSVNAGFAMKDYWIWCGSVIKGDDGRYHMFASRWKKTLPMHPGWLLESEIVRASADTPDGEFQFEEIVLEARGAEYWDGRSTHNPHIIKWNNKYVLYYMGTTHPFTDVKDVENITLDDPRVICARANKRIGVAVSESIYGPWERMDEPVLDVRPKYFDNFLVSNPAPCIMPDGKILLMYKARTYEKKPYPEYLHGKMWLGVAVANSPFEKHYPLLDKPVFEDEEYEIEDPFIWYDSKGYQMIAKDMKGNICGEKFGGVYAKSDNGFEWEFQKNKIFYSRKILFDDGITREMGNLERPFILFEEERPICAYFAVSDGKDGKGFTNCTKTWNMAIALK